MVCKSGLVSHPFVFWASCISHGGLQWFLITTVHGRTQSWGSVEMQSFFYASNLQPPFFPNKNTIRTQHPSSSSFWKRKSRSGSSPGMNKHSWLRLMAGQVFQEREIPAFHSKWDFLAEQNKICLSSQRAGLAFISSISIYGPFSPVLQLSEIFLVLGSLAISENSP